MPDNSSIWLERHSFLLQGMRRGIEKESLRVDATGQLARTPHPITLGSALTHPHITTDYSEALLELITPALFSIQDTLDFLSALHVFIQQQLPHEMLWSHSMPCFLGEDSSVPLAQYGNSAIAQMKTVYRHGLGLRYTRRMQTIAGIHYNLSFPESFWQEWHEQQDTQLSLRDFSDSKYFGLIRNFQRYSWLLIYLLGATPAVCASFMRNRPHHLQHNAHHTLFLPHATSLRMSDIGYQNTLQSDLHICYNRLSEYVQGLNQAIRTPFPAFSALGTRNAEGEYIQLNDHILQIENEYYGLIRPKRSPEPDERPGLALMRRGVEYIEMRCVDLNPFSALGIDSTDAHFLEVFALYCLMQPSPFLDTTDLAYLTENQKRITTQGRNPDLKLWQKTTNGCSESPFQTQALSLLGAMDIHAEALDRAHNTLEYSQSVHRAAQRIQNPDSSYSARLLSRIQNPQDSSQTQTFFGLACEQSRQHHQYWQQQSLTASMQEHLDSLVHHSWEKHHAIEEKQRGLSLETYLSHYFAESDHTTHGQDLSLSKQL